MAWPGGVCLGVSGVMMKPIHQKICPLVRPLAPCTSSPAPPMTTTTRLASPSPPQLTEFHTFSLNTSDNNNHRLKYTTSRHLNSSYIHKPKEKGNFHLEQREWPYKTQKENQITPTIPTTTTISALSAITTTTTNSHNSVQPVKCCY